MAYDTFWAEFLFNQPTYILSLIAIENVYMYHCKWYDYFWSLEKVLQFPNPASLLCGRCILPFTFHSARTVGTKKHFDPHLLFTLFPLHPKLCQIRDRSSPADIIN